MKLKVDTRSRQGFTLIELLVVIAIIGLLAAVVLAAVGTARSKGADAAIKSQMNAARSQGELYATGNSNSYNGLCAASATAVPAGLAGILANAASQGGKGGGVVTGTGGVGAVGAWNTVTCHDSVGAWAAEAPLSASVSGTPSMWCVDSNGAAKAEGATVLPVNATKCS